MLSLLAAAFTASTFSTFESWADRYGKVYQPTERDYRQTVYEQNLAKILNHNAAGHSWTMDVNQFADLTSQEFASRYVSGGYMRRSPRTHTNKLRGNTNVSLPTSVDWTTQGAVTPVKDQGQCGSCWAFSTTGSVESAWFQSNGTLVSLSEQQLVDCSTSQGNDGCNGGLMDYGFEYIISNKGLTTEDAYPYSATGPNTCVSAGLLVAARISNYVDVVTNSDNALMTAIAQQPVSVAVEADQNSFQFYSGGVMTAACGSNLDHGVLAVGYGTSSGLDYYKVKNSWGATWGDKGYILLGRGSKFGSDGQCGILMDPSYPVV